MKKEGRTRETAQVLLSLCNLLSSVGGVVLLLPQSIVLATGRQTWQHSNALQHWSTVLHYNLISISMTLHLHINRLITAVSYQTQLLQFFGIIRGCLLVFVTTMLKKLIKVPDYNILELFTPPAINIFQHSVLISAFSSGWCLYLCSTS